MRSLRGQFVLAGPKMEDPNFQRAVIVMIEHHPPAKLGPMGEPVSFVPQGDEDDEHTAFTAPLGDSEVEHKNDDQAAENPGDTGPAAATLTGTHAGALGLVVNHELPIPVAEAWTQVSDNDCLVHGNLRRGGPCTGPLMILHRRPDRAQFRVAQGVYFTTHEPDVRWLIEQHGDDVLVFTGYSGWGAGQLEMEVEHGAWLAVPGSADQLFHPNVATLWPRLIAQADPTLGRVVRNPRIVPDDPSLN